MEINFRTPYAIDATLSRLTGCIPHRSPFFAAAAALILAALSLHKVVTLERVQREGSKKKEYDSVADEWVHQRVTESESDDDSVEALTVRTPLQ